MRWPTVEVLGRDLWVGSSSSGPGIDEEMRKGEWWDLCSMWSGVWGLKLVIKGKATLRSCPLNSLPKTSETSGEASKADSILNTELEWIQDGLLCLHQLRWVEIEIEDESVDRDVKLRFCHELGKVMGDVRVVFIERIRVEVPDKEFKWYGGAPPS